MTFLSSSPQGRGKTTLVHAIQGKPPPPNISTVGIIVEQFVLPLRNQYYFYSSPSPEIMFSVWDLAGQQVYYATHQCFLSGKTLYLVVYNVTHGSEGIDSLGSWLLNIQVCSFILLTLPILFIDPAKTNCFRNTHMSSLSLNHYE